MNRDKIRLSSKDLENIISTIKQADALSQIFLYGSRVKLDHKGGDIDLLVISEKLSFSNKITILAKLKELLGDQKIDLSIKTKSHIKSDPFFQSVDLVEVD